MQKTLPIHFAPLQGYTDVIYRNAHAACFGGIDTYYTPFVRLEKGSFRHRDIRVLHLLRNACTEEDAHGLLKRLRRFYPYSLKRDIRKPTLIWDVLFPY